MSSAIEVVALQMLTNPCFQREIQGTRKHIYRLENPYPSQRKVQFRPTLSWDSRGWRYGHRVWCPNTTPGRVYRPPKMFKRVILTYLARGQRLALRRPTIVLRLVEPLHKLGLRAWWWTTMIYVRASYIFHLAATSEADVAGHQERDLHAGGWNRMSYIFLWLRDIWSQEEDGSIW
jgi:hypothetical protein